MDSGRLPRELILFRNIQEFGAQSILGRPLGKGEIIRMRYANSLYAAYQSRKIAENWAIWANENPEMNVLLADAMMAGEDGH